MSPFSCTPYERTRAHSGSQRMNPDLRKKVDMIRAARAEREAALQSQSQAQVRQGFISLPSIPLKYLVQSYVAERPRCIETSVG